MEEREVPVGGVPVDEEQPSGEHLSEKQRKGLEILEGMDLEKFNSLKTVEKKCSWIGRVFMWIDDNILSKTTRLWMYFLEVAGVIFIYIIMKKVETGLGLVASSKTALDIQKAKVYIDALSNLAPAIAAMVATICAAIPTVMGVFRSLKKKWVAPSNGNAVKA